MPNHYETKVVITGPAEEVAQFKAKHLSNELCNTVIPMPKCLEGIESSSTLDEAVAAMKKDPVSQWKFIVDKWGTQYVDMAKRAIDAEAECGHRTWYTWCNESWGTKWGVYELRVTSDKPRRLAFNFQSAWAPPMPVFCKLCEMYPRLKFTLKGRDEFERSYEDLTPELHQGLMNRE